MRAGERGANEGGAGRGWKFSSRARKVVLAVHVVASVALVGSAACMLVLALLAAGDRRIVEADVLYGALRTLLRVVVVPLSATALVSGVALGVGTHWGILRHRWVTAKLGLLVASTLTALLVIAPSTRALTDPASGLTAVGPPDFAATRWDLVGAAVLNILFAATSSVLSVFKPGSRAKVREHVVPPDAGFQRSQRRHAMRRRCAT